MVYQIQRKLFSIGGSFNVLNDSGETVYMVRVEKVLPAVLSVVNMSGVEVCRLKGTFNFTGKFVATDSSGKELFAARPTVTLTKNVVIKPIDESFQKMRIKGGFFGWKYRFVCDGQKVAVMRLKNPLGIRDTMRLEIFEEDQYFNFKMLMVAIAVCSLHSPKKDL